MTDDRPTSAGKRCNMIYVSEVLHLICNVSSYKTVSCYNKKRFVFFLSKELSLNNYAPLSQPQQLFWLRVS